MNNKDELVRIQFDGGDPVLINIRKNLLIQFIREGVFMAQASRDRVLSMIPEIEPLEPGESPIETEDLEEFGRALDAIEKDIRDGEALLAYLDPKEKEPEEPEF